MRKNPMPSRWYASVDAVEPAEMCIQMNYFLPNPIVMGSEDCLYLNIFRPNIDYNDDTKLNVMVYIPEGGSFPGLKNPNFTGPAYFMKERSVILVMVQYRVSVFGFLSTGDRNSPGNFGLKDQALALKWIKDHIESFGGNPDSITIFGHGVSVHMHMMSPLSQSLFHKAIAMSGSAIDPYNYPTLHPKALARKLAKAVGVENVDNLNSRNLMKNLRQVKAEALVRSVAKLDGFSLDPLTLFRTVVEPNARDAFLIEDPRILLKNGKFARIPFMTGVVDIEGAARAGAFMYNTTHFNELNKNLYDFLPKILEINVKNYQRAFKGGAIVSDPELRNSLNIDHVIPRPFEPTVTDDKLDNFMENVKQRYLDGNSQIYDQNLFGFMQMFTDYAYYYPLYKSLPHMINRIPVYLYKFSYRGQNSFCNSYTGTDSDYGIVHGDDLIYLFDSPPRYKRRLNTEDQLASVKLVNTFTQFAGADKPNLPRCFESDMKPICKFTHFYSNLYRKFDITGTSGIGTNFVNLWDQLEELTNFQTSLKEEFAADSKQGAVDNTNMEDALDDVSDNENEGLSLVESEEDKFFTGIIDLLKEVVMLMVKTEKQSKKTELTSEHLLSRRSKSKTNFPKVKKD